MTKKERGKYLSDLHEKQKTKNRKELKIKETADKKIADSK